MDLLSGYSDNNNYGNGYTPLANNAINNNNADYMRNQLATQQAGQYDPFAQSGGFGNQTSYYAGLGRDYTTATGGNIYGGGGGGPDISAQWDLWRMGGMKGPQPGSEPQPQPQVDWQKYFNDVSGPQSYSKPNNGYNQGDNAYGDIYGGLPAVGFQPMPNPSAQRLLGYDPSAAIRGAGDISAQWDLWRMGGMKGPQPGANTMASGGDPSYFDAGQPGSSYNPFGKINSGQVGQYDAFGGYRQPIGQPYGPAYFDNTFGSTAQNGVGSFNSRFPAPNTPGMTSSDQSEAARQQAIQDLMRTLGTTVAPSYDPHTPQDTWTNRS